MGRSAGTGFPISHRCSRCKTRIYTRGEERRGYRTQPTGRRGDKRHSGMGNPRVSSTHTYEYICGDCGFIGWTSHIDIARKYEHERAKAGSSE